MGNRAPVAARTFRAMVFAVAFLGFALATHGGAPVAPPAAVTMEVFVRDGCPHCTDAKAWLETLRRERPNVTIRLRPVDRDPEAAALLERLSREAGVAVPGVPSFVVGDRMLVGFDDGARTGPRILALVDRATPAPGTVDSPFFGTLSADRLGLPLFTLALGLLDGFNPCAMWVLLFLLSLLVRLNDRRRMALVAGTFVLVSGAVYYAFMAAWLTVFLAIGLSSAVRWTLAGAAILIGAVNVKDFFAFGRGVSLSIPEGAKPGIYARTRAILSAETLPASLLAVAALAVVVNFVELLCTAGLPAIYTAVLTQHDLSAPARHAYLALYIAGYIADDTLMVATAVIALGNRKLTERSGRWLKLLSGAIMLALGIVMAAKPEWLF
jgi:glutaredoxin